MLNVDWNQQTGRPVARLTFGLLWWASLLRRALASQHVGVSSCRWGVAKGLQCVVFLIKILLHSHNVIDTCPNPNNIRYRSTCGSGWSHRLYGFYDFMPFKQEGKKSKSDMIEVPAAQDSARVQAAFSLWFPLYTTVYKELRSMDSSSLLSCGESITAPLPSSVPWLQQSQGTGCVSQLYSHILL